MLSNEAIKNMKDRTRLLLMTQNKTQVSVSRLVSRSEGIPDLISKWFSTPYHLSLEHAILLAEELDISPDYLVFGVGVPQRKSELYEPLFTQDEMEMLWAFQGMAMEEKNTFLSIMKSQIPTNAFCSEVFLSGNKEQMNHNMEDFARYELEEIKQRAIQVMEERNMTAADFCRYLGTVQEPEGFMEHWLYQTTYMSLRKGLILADILDVSVDYLFFGIGSSHQRSRSFSLELNDEEKTLLQHFRKSSLKQQLQWLKLFQTWIPENTFCPIQIFLKGENGDADMAAAEERIRLMLEAFGRKLRFWYH